MASLCSYTDLCFAWGVAASTFYSERGVIWPTTEAIDLTSHMGLPLDDTDKLEELSKGFYGHSGGIFNGCVVVIDGLAALTQQPYDKEVKYKKDYHCRKEGFAIIVIAGCGVNCHFIVAICKHSGSTNTLLRGSRWNFLKL
jgi:hypothetical protein